MNYGPNTQISIQPVEEGFVRIVLIVAETNESFLMDLEIGSHLDTIIKIREVCSDRKAEVFYEDETSHLFIKLPASDMYQLCENIDKWVNEETN